MELPMIEHTGVARLSGLIRGYGEDSESQCTDNEDQFY